MEDIELERYTGTGSPKKIGARAAFIERRQSDVLVFEAAKICLV
jgi:hypothetical protein